MTPPRMFETLESAKRRAALSARFAALMPQVIDRAASLYQPTTESNREPRINGRVNIHLAKRSPKLGYIYYVRVGANTAAENVGSVGRAGKQAVSNPFGAIDFGYFCSLASGDIDLDGNPDLLVASDGTTPEKIDLVCDCAVRLKALADHHCCSACVCPGRQDQTLQKYARLLWLELQQQRLLF